MNKFAAPAIAIALLAGAPVVAQAPTASKPVVGIPAAGFKTDELGCLVRLNMFRQTSQSRLADQSLTTDQRKEAYNNVIFSDGAMSFYAGRLSMGANDPYRSQRAQAVLNALKAAPGPQTNAEVSACLLNARDQLKAVLTTLNPK